MTIDKITIHPECRDAGARLYAVDLAHSYDAGLGQRTIIVIPYFLETWGGHFALVKDGQRWLEFHRWHDEQIEAFVARVALEVDALNQIAGDEQVQGRTAASAPAKRHGAR